MSSRIAAERALFAAVLSALIARGGDARAQSQPSFPTPPQDAAVAQSLFDEARRLMIDGRFAEACPKLAESERLDPALGTLLNLAVCNERLGMTASAWSEYRDAESVAKRQGRDERAAYSHERAVAIEPRLSRLVLARGAGSADRGLEVTLDGNAVGEATFGTAVPIDPGAHRVEARAPGKKPWAASVTIGGPTDRQRVEIPALEDAPLAAAPAPPAAANENGPLAITLPSAPPPETRAAPPPLPRSRTTAYVVGGAGLAALAVGSVAGVQALVKWNDRRALCAGDACSQAGLDADGAARRWALVADVGLAVGVAGLATAGYLLLTSKSESTLGPERTVKRLELSPIALTAGGGMALHGAW